MCMHLVCVRACVRVCAYVCVCVCVCVCRVRCAVCVTRRVIECEVSTHDSLCLELARC